MEIVGNRETGLFILPNGPRGMAGAFERLLVDRNYRPTLSERGRWRGEQELDAAPNARRILDCLAAAATSRHPKAAKRESAHPTTARQTRSMGENAPGEDDCLIRFRQPHIPRRRRQHNQAAF